MLTTATVLDTLQRAADAHGVHEAEDLGGAYDQQWPLWYTEHMAVTLASEGHRLDSRVIGDALQLAASAHAAREQAAGNSGGDWRPWYAEYMTPMLAAVVSQSGRADKHAQQKESKQ